MTEKITEPSRQTPVLALTDVLVVGGGPAGISAAIGAADAGAAVIIAERYGFLGGIPAICNMEPSSWCRQKDTVMPGGVQALLEQKMLACGAAEKPLFEPSASYNYDTETLKFVIDELLEEHHITPIYHCLVTEPYMEDDSVKGVFTESKSGRQAILAKRVIDCTGDADIAAQCGAPFEKCSLGGDEKENMMYGTLIFGASNVNVPKVRENLKEHPEMLDRIRHEFISDGFSKARENHYPIPPHGFQNQIIFNRMTQGEVTAINRVRVPVDGNDVLSLTEAEILSRKEALDTLELLRRYEPGFEEACLRHFAAAVGIRETRRIVGDYQLTMEDITGERQFDDSVGVYPVCMDGPKICRAALTGAHFQIPYRIMLPQGIENLLVAGRSVSATKDATHTTRGVDFCMITGQAAGIASALSIQKKVPVRDISIDLLQKNLQQQGVQVF